MREVQGSTCKTVIIQHHGAVSSQKSSASFSQVQASVRTHTGSHQPGKGLIDKVVVSPAAGAGTDVVDLRTSKVRLLRYMCPHMGCGKPFSTCGHARRHSRTHDFLRPFQCPHEGCHATFTRRDNCTQHQKIRHKFQLKAHRMGDEP